jgi:hypothetical protein
LTQSPEVQEVTINIPETEKEAALWEIINNQYELINTLQEVVNKFQGRNHIRAAVKRSRK